MQRPCRVHPGCWVSFSRTRHGLPPPEGKKAWVFHHREERAIDCGVLRCRWPATRSNRTGEAHRWPTASWSKEVGAARPMRRTRQMAGKVSRSAITGRFVKPSTAARHPKTTVTETVKPKK